LSEVVAIAAGGGHSLALRADNTLWAWGVNGFGQLGDGTMTDRLTPVQVSGLTDAVAIAAGYWHSLALTREDTGGTGSPQGYRRQYRPRTEGLFARIVRVIDERRQNDQEAYLAALREVQERSLSDYATLRKDLNTVAVNTDDGLSQAREQLIELATLRQPPAH